MVSTQLPKRRVTKRDNVHLGYVTAAQASTDPPPERGSADQRARK